MTSESSLIHRERPSPDPQPVCPKPISRGRQTPEAIEARIGTSTSESAAATAPHARTRPKVLQGLRARDTLEPCTVWTHHVWETVKHLRLTNDMSFPSKFRNDWFGYAQSGIAQWHAFQDLLWQIYVKREARCMVRSPEPTLTVIVAPKVMPIIRRIRLLTC